MRVAPDCDMDEVAVPMDEVAAHYVRCLRTPERIAMVFVPIQGRLMQLRTDGS